VDLTVNGETRRLPAGSTVDVVVTLVGADLPRGVAVAVNGEVVPRAEWAGTRLRAGDSVEVLTAVAGG
jgi:sulfur carrier protein